MFDWIFKWGSFFLGLMFTPAGLLVLISEISVLEIPGSKILRKSSMIAIFGQDFTQIVSGLSLLICGLFLILIGLTYKPPPDLPDD